MPGSKTVGVIIVKRKGTPKQGALHISALEFEDTNGKH